MTDCVFIEDLKLDAIIGCLAHERVQTQPIHLNLDLYFDFQQASDSDQLQDTICYADIVEQLSHYVANTQFQLIEKLGEAICQWLFDHYAIQKVRLCLRKPNAIEQAKTVGVILERARPQFA